MEDLKTITLDILTNGNYLHLATVDEQGPWSAILFYVHDDLNLYWLSQPTTRHSNAIRQFPYRVAGTITLTQKPGEPDIGLQLEGRAYQLETISLPIAARYQRKRNKPPLEFGIDFLEAGQAWYQLYTESIEIINQPLWGRERKTLTL